MGVKGHSVTCLSVSFTIPMPVLGDQGPLTLLVGFCKGALGSETQLQCFEDGKCEAQRGKGICPKSHSKSKWQSQHENWASASQYGPLPSPDPLIYLFSLTVSKLSLPRQHALAPTTIPARWFGLNLSDPSHSRPFLPRPSVAMLSAPGSAPGSIRVPQPSPSRKPALAIKPNPCAHTHPHPYRHALP